MRSYLCIPLPHLDSIPVQSLSEVGGRVQIILDQRKYFGSELRLCVGGLCRVPLVDVADLQAASVETLYFHVLFDQCENSSGFLLVTLFEP